jgi:TonB-linked SusC/RagA family outer membrane protein
MTIMRTFIFLLCTTVFSLNTTNSFAQEKVTIDVDKVVSIDEVFDIIQEQTKYRFIYPQDLFLNSPEITLNKGIINISSLLEKCFSGTNVNFKLSENNTIVIEKSKSIKTPIYNQQKILVRGIVKDQNGQLLPGANIIEKATNNGTQTDFDGNFSLSVSNEDAVLVVSYLGFATQEITVKNQNYIEIVLVEESGALDEIVLIGYGTVKKKDATGSVVSIKSEDFNKGNIVTPENLLQGRVAGLSINTGGGPGSGSVIRIRGGASLNASNDPLIVIDGLPIDNTSVGGSRSILSTINPSEIESFTVLKDASATAIYGSRASNGVIIISTKRGKKSIRVNLDSSVSYNTLTNTVNVFSAEELRALVTEQNPALLPRLGTANTDWQREIYKNTLSTNVNLSVRGALFKEIPVRLSVGRSEQNGLRLTSKFQRNTASLSVNPNFFDNKLKISFNGNYSNEQNRFASGQEANALTFDPTQPVYEPNSPFGGFFQFYENNNDGVINQDDLVPLAPFNPVAELLQRRSLSEVNRFFGNFKVDYSLHFLPELTTTLNLGLDRQDADGMVNVSDQNPLSQADGSIVGSQSEYQNSQVNLLLDAYINYKKSFGKFNLDATAGYSWQRFEREGFNTNELLDDTDASLPLLNIDTDLVLLGYFGRANLALKDKYLLTLTYRRDGTSRFSEENRWGNFPSAAFAWQLKDEFFKESEQLSNFKLRLGWGITGQQDIGSDNLDLYLDGYVTGIPNSQYQFGNSIIPIGLPEFRNEQLKWEETTTYNVGLDMGILDDRFTASVDVFRKESKDLLVFAAVSDGSNFSNSGFQNIGEMTTQGLEFLLQGDIIKHNDDGFNFNVSFNASIIRRELTSLFQDEDIITGTASGGTGIDVQIQRVGYNPFSFYVYKQVYGTDGFPIEGNYADLNGDNIINDDDRYIFNNNDPSASFGFASNLSYKGFDFSFNMRAVVGNYVYNNVNSARAQYNLLDNNSVVSNIPTSVLQTNFVNTENVILSDAFIENASFLRMDNISLGYTFKNLVSSKLQLRLSASVQNAFVVTNYSGLDPEVFNNGIDDTIYPRPRTFLFNTSFQF